MSLTPRPIRRIAMIELADLNEEAVALAAKIQENFEGLGV